MKTILSIFIFTCLTFLLIPLDSFSQAIEEQTLMTIGNQEISTEEFKRIYLKNRGIGEEGADKVTVDDYLDLFMNFKLKVIAAEDLGYDTLPSFKKEFEGYKNQLAKPYLTDENTIDQLVKEAYERMQYNINASHILVKTNPDASPEDTLKAYEKVDKIAKRLKTGESFEKVARGASDDPSAKSNGGNLGYFTVFQTVYTFETAAYNTKPGNMVFPVRTRFGYHIIKVNDRRKAIGEIKVAHIMVAVPRGSSPDIKEEAKQKIQMIESKLQAGDSFEELARKYSDDYNSARNGGELPWFGTGRMVKAFETASFNLQKNGDISKPVQTGFGWHVIKRIDRKEIGTFDETKDEIRKKIYSGSREEVALDVFINNLKKKYHFSLDSANIKSLYNAIDINSFQNGTWEKRLSYFSGETLFSFAEKKYTTKDFIPYLKTQRGIANNESSKWYVNQMLNAFIEKELVSYEEINLEEEYPDYRYLLKEYHDGMLLFEISDKNVWSKAIIDTSGLEMFYEQHKNNYLGKDSIEIAQFSLEDASREKSLNKNLKKCKKSQNEMECIRSSFPPDSIDAPITLSVNKYEKGEDYFIDKLNWKKGFKKSVIESGRNKIILVMDVLDPKPVPLEKIRGQVTSDYQNFLEEKWIKELKKKYPVKVNQKTLTKLKSTIDTTK